MCSKAYMYCTIITILHIPRHNYNSSINISSIYRLVYHFHSPSLWRFNPFIIIFRLAGDAPRISVFSNRRSRRRRAASRRLDSTWCNFGRFKGGRALIWQPITMPPAMATNSARRNCTWATVVESVPIAVEACGLGQPCSSSLYFTPSPADSSTALIAALTFPLLLVVRSSKLCFSGGYRIPRKDIVDGY